MSKPLKIAVLGFWHVHAGDYARQTQQHSGTEVVAVWDDDLTRGEAGADEFGVPFAEDLDALLGRSDLDGVVVTTATSAHRDVMVMAANAGKHIFTEKLLAPTVPEAEEIIAAADENSVKLVVSLPRLSHGYTQAIREVIEDGRAGLLQRLRPDHDGLASQQYDEWRWRANRHRLPPDVPDAASGRRLPGRGDRDADPVDTFVAEIGHFADSLLDDTRPLHTEEEGIAVLGILLAAYQGARTKTIAPVLQP